MIKFFNLPASRYQKKEKKKQMKPMINLNNFKMWRPDDKNCPQFAREFQIAKFAVFKAQVNITETISLQKLPHVCNKRIVNKEKTWCRY